MLGRLSAFFLCASLLAGTANAASWSCDELPALVDANHLEPGTQAWNLPVSSRQPELLTNAWMSVTLVEGEARVKIFFIRPPGTVGLPFTFQQLALTWDEQGAERSLLVDWSAECTNPGRSIFPGQEIEAVLSLPVIPNSPIRLRLWGSRN